MKRLENDGRSIQINKRDKETLVICSNEEEQKAQEDLENAIAVDLGLKKSQRVSNRGKER